MHRRRQPVRDRVAATSAGSSSRSPRCSRSALAVVLVAALHLVLRRTFVGRGMRAFAEDRTVAAAFGIDHRRLGPAARRRGRGQRRRRRDGVRAGQLRSRPTAAYEWFGIVFAVVILGGIGNVARHVRRRHRGRRRCPAWCPRAWSPAAAPIVLFLAIILALLLRPQGLFAPARCVAVTGRRAPAPASPLAVAGLLGLVASAFVRREPRRCPGSTSCSLDTVAVLDRPGDQLEPAVRVRRLLQLRSGRLRRRRRLHDGGADRPARRQPICVSIPVARRCLGAARAGDRRGGVPAAVAARRDLRAAHAGRAVHPRRGRAASTRPIDGGQGTRPARRTSPTGSATSSTCCSCSTWRSPTLAVGVACAIQHGRFGWALAAVHDAEDVGRGARRRRRSATRCSRSLLGGLLGGDVRRGSTRCRSASSPWRASSG